MTAVGVLSVMLAVSALASAFRLRVWRNNDIAGDVYQYYALSSYHHHYCYVVIYQATIYCNT